MATEGKRWHREPKLSKKPHPRTGKYYISVRVGKTAKIIPFTENREDSEKLRKEWVYENVTKPSHDGTMIAEPVEAGKVSPRSLTALFNEFLQQEVERTRKVGDDRQGRTLAPRRGYYNQEIILAMNNWCEGQFGRRCLGERFDELIGPSEYEAMMKSFKNKKNGKPLSKPQMAERRQMFWRLATYNQRKPYGGMMSFTPKMVTVPEGTPTQGRKIPGIAVVKRLMEVMDEKEQLWFFLGIGCGFGQGDLSECTKECFGPKFFDLTRAKTRIDREGRMFPQVWARLQKYFRAHPEIKEHDRLFLTKNGLPLVHERDKTEEEMRLSDTKTQFAKTDSVYLRWKNKLLPNANLKDWDEGFYVLRHVAATALGTRRDISLTEMRGFMGQSCSTRSIDRYLHGVREKNREFVEWINAVLDSHDTDAWKKLRPDVDASSAVKPSRESKQG